MQQRNDDRAVDFLRLASRGDVEQAFARYVARDFRHHNPWFAGDASSLMRAMADNARQHPAKSCETLRTVAEGELVCVHSRIRLEPEGREVAWTYEDCIVRVQVPSFRIHAVLVLEQETAPASGGETG